MKRIGSLSEARRLRWLDAMHPEAFTEYDGYQMYHTTPKSMYVKLRPGGILKRHRDTTGEERGQQIIRVHHVLQTNDKAVNYEGDLAYFLDEGGIYELDVAQWHSAENHGESDRIHFVTF